MSETKKITKPEYTDQIFDELETNLGFLWIRLHTVAWQIIEYGEKDAIDDFLLTKEQVDLINKLHLS